MKQNLTYKEAVTRLETIVRHIEQDSPDVDELTKLVAEAVELTKFCRSKLTHADQQLTTMMAHLSEDPAAQSAESPSPEQ
jgi:exonuclease VII small subunit